MARPKKEPPALQHFISLRAAAALAYTAATGKHTSDIQSLNNMARLVAERTRVFTRGADGEPERVLPLEFNEGRIESGGEQLRFSDGRPTLLGLTILQRELGTVIEQIRKLYDAQRRDSG